MQKTALITGATQGIGLATSQRLLAKGWQVVGIARKENSAFKGHFFKGDLSSMQETENILKDILKQHTIDALINNVGIAVPQLLGEIDLATFYSVYDLNVRTAVQLTQAVVEHMKEQRWGRIVNIASRAILGVKGRTSYGAAKSALVACARTWALELAPYHITVNAVAPGPIETPLFRKTRPVGSEAEAAVLREIPLGRIGQPFEIAATLEFLLSNDAAFMTGQTLFVDGGGSI